MDHPFAGSVINVQELGATGNDSTNDSDRLSEVRTTPGRGQGLRSDASGISNRRLRARCCNQARDRRRLAQRQS
jgi:hypothetical protein